MEREARSLEYWAATEKCLGTRMAEFDMDGYSLLSDLNIGINTINYWNGLNQNAMEYAVRSSFKSARTWNEFRQLKVTQQSWRVNNVLGKTGANYLKTVRGLGYVGGAASVIVTGYNALSFYSNGGSGWEVGAKAFLDGAMVIVGFMGPLGFCISTTYFLLDMATDGFGGFGSIK